MLSIAIVKKFYPNVTKVVDAPKSVTIDVTRKDSGKVKDHSKCVLAIACRTKLHADGAIISMRKAFLIKGNTAVRYSVPEYVSRELVAFDRGAPFAPGRYVLNKPHKISKVKKTKRTNPSPVRRVHHVTAGVRAPLPSL